MLTHLRMSPAGPRVVRPNVRRAQPRVVAAAGALPAKVNEESAVTAGGIVLPSSAVNKPTTGIVSAIGDGKNAKTGNVVPIDVKVGDRVVYSKYAGTEVTVGDEAHLILKSEDVIGTLDGDDIAHLKPYGDRVLVIKAALTPSTSGGVVLPSSAADAVPTGRVKAVGPGKLRDDGGRDPMPLSAGVAVLYQQYAGMEFPADDAAPAGYVVLRSDDVLVRLD